MSLNSFKRLLGVAWLFTTATAQLTATLTSEPDVPQNITITVQNPSKQNVSVLATNNLFDVLHDSQAVTVQASNGTSLPQLTSTIAYLGTLYTDLLNLEPGATFAREIDLTQYLAPPIAGGNLSYVISVPSVFEGIVGPSLAPPNIPTTDADPEGSANDTSPSWNATLSGDLDEAQLQNITLAASPINVTITWPAQQLAITGATSFVNVINGRPGSPVNDPPQQVETERKRRRQVVTDDEWEAVPIHLNQAGSGISVNASCPSKTHFFLTQAVTNAGLLAGAAQTAARTGGYPFNFFFRDGDQSRVQDVMGNVVAAVANQTGSAQVEVMCNDWKNWCSLKGGRIGGYAHNAVVAESGSALSSVVLCPRSLGFSLEGQPCTNPPSGQVTLGYIMLHELMHINAIANGPHIGDIVYGERNSHNLAGNGGPGDPKANADNYAWLGSWAWTLGFGNWAGSACPTKWPAPLD